MNCIHQRESLIICHKYSLFISSREDKKYVFLPIIGILLMNKYDKIMNILNLLLNKYCDCMANIFLKLIGKNDEMLRKASHLTILLQLVYLYACWEIVHVFFLCRLFSKLTFSQILSGTLSSCQMVWIQIRTDEIRIWVQTVCKG